MDNQKINPNVVALISLLLILGIAMISDRIVWQLQWQARETPNFSLVYWVQTITTLILGVTVALVAWYLFTRAPVTRTMAWVYVVVGLLLLFYPQLYLSQIPWVQFSTIGPLSRLFNYLAQYHWQGLMYTSSGIITGIGLVSLLYGRQSNNSGNP